MWMVFNEVCAQEEAAIFGSHLVWSSSPKASFQISSGLPFHLCCLSCQPLLDSSKMAVVLRKGFEIGPCIQALGTNPQWPYIQV